MQYWTGPTLTSLQPNEVFVFGSNPEGRHGAGAAKAAMSFGAKYGNGRGLTGQSYAIVTKNLTAGYVSNGVTYHKAGPRSVSESDIRAEIDALYDFARKNPDKKFLITYKYLTTISGAPKASLNGYNSEEMLQMFVRPDIPANIVFHESYKGRLKPRSSVMVVSPRDRAPAGFTVINTTSRDNSMLSPFNLGPIELYDGTARNLENAWQFSKVYKEFDSEGSPTPEYFKWAQKGWADTYAHRYPYGKGAVPLYSYWRDSNGAHKWGYIEARKNIYFPLYAKAIVKTDVFKELQKRVESGEHIALWDFDGYDHVGRGMTYKDVVHSEKYKCGHAFVVYGLLTGELKIIGGELVYDFEQKITPPLAEDYPAKFTYKNYTFFSVTQFIAFSLAKNINDEEVASKILNVDITNGFKAAHDIIAKLKPQVLPEKVASLTLFGTREKLAQNPEIELSDNTVYSALIERVRDKLLAERKTKMKP